MNAFVLTEKYHDDLSRSVPLPYIHKRPRVDCLQSRPLKRGKSDETGHHRVYGAIVVKGTSTSHHREGIQKHPPRYLEPARYPKYSELGRFMIYMTYLQRVQMARKNRQPQDLRGNAMTVGPCARSSRGGGVKEFERKPVIQ